MTVILKLFAWLLAAAVAFATLGPPGLRPHSDLGQDGEHGLAFVLVGLAFGLAYSRRRWAVSAIAIVAIGGLELLQLWAPGRHARLEDFVVDALTACLGFALSAVLERAITRFRTGAITSEGPAE
jgi:VanZ family protein